VFFGHIAVGLAAKTVSPKVPLGVLLLSVTGLDVLSGIFFLAGIEYVDVSGASYYPWSHGLFMSLVWSLLGGALAYMFFRDRRTGLIVGLLVFSHWVLDFISHPMGFGQKLPPDLPLLFEGSPKVGLGLYNHSLAGALIIEFSLFAAGIAIYLINTRPKDRLGKWAFWLMLIFILLVTLPAASPRFAVLTTLAMVLLLPIGNWVDRHRPLAKALVVSSP
jgi:hypothetical protein